jgi:hypothetical protein
MQTVRKISSFHGADPFVRAINSNECDHGSGFNKFVLLPDGVTIASISGGTEGIHLWQLDPNGR